MKTWLVSLIILVVVVAMALILFHFATISHQEPTPQEVEKKQIQNEYDSERDAYYTKARNAYQWCYYRDCSVDSYMILIQLNNTDSKILEKLDQIEQELSKDGNLHKG